MPSVSPCDSRARRNNVIAEELGGGAPMMMTQRNEHCFMFTIKKIRSIFLYFDKNQKRLETVLIKLQKEVWHSDPYLLP